MSKESKIFSPNLWSTQDTITHYESFGWELLSLNGNQIVMSRESQNSVYPELVKFQKIYEDTAAEYNSLKAPTPPVKPIGISFGICFITFLLFLIPCIIYVAYKLNQNNEYQKTLQAYNASLAEYNNRRSALLEKMKSTVEQSRVVFFSKHD